MKTTPKRAEITGRLAQVIGEAPESQRRLAKALGKAVSTLTGWKNGRTEPDLSTVATLCERLGISADWLLGLSPAPAQLAVREDGGTYDVGDQSEVELLKLELAQRDRELAEARIEIAAGERALHHLMTKTMKDVAREVAREAVREAAAAPAAEAPAKKARKR